MSIDRHSGQPGEVMSDNAWRDGIGTAEALRRGELTYVDVLEEAIARAEHLNPELGFLVESMADSARTHVRGVPEGPLSGVPFLLKDHLATHAGVRHTSGSVFLRDNVATRDSELVRRFKAAGLIPIGTSATCEFALLSTAESAAHGPCRNPWDPTRIAGGSSGGAAAAVAAGVVPVAHGNDSGGSIRIPASACGVFGLKPSRGRISLGPAFGDLAGGIWSEHVITRTVRDSAAVLDAVHGALPGDPYTALPPRRSYLAELRRTRVERLRIAYTASPPTGTPVSADCIEALNDAAALCEHLGHELVEAQLPGDLEAFETSYFVLVAAGAAAWLDHWIGIVGRRPDSGELEPFTAAVVEHGRGFSAPELLAAIENIQRAGRQISTFLTTFDLFLTPTLAHPPVPLGYFATAGAEPLDILSRDAEYAPFTWIANAAGLPAMSVPLHWNSEGLPIGSHFMARTGREDLLFRFAAQLEAARPWLARWPSVASSTRSAQPLTTQQRPSPTSQRPEN